MSRPLVHLIDDDETSGKLLQSSLQMRGYEANWTPEIHALQLDQERSNVIVLDLAMPGMDGFQTIDRIAQDASDARLVIASGQHPRIISAAVGSAEAAGLAVLGSLQKPYTARRLIELLEQRLVSSQVTHGSDEAWVQARVADGSLASQVTVHFQPKHRLATADVVGFEALSRISDGPAISPDLLFGPLVPFETRFELTANVIRASAAAVRIFGGSGLSIAFNCPADILCFSGFIPLLEHVVAEAGIQRSDLVVELTEHPTLEGLNNLSRAASRLTMLGYGFAVDDFGRGLASFEVLTRLPFSELKIDKEVFWSTLQGDAAAPMLREVIAYCRSHNIKTTIEGIETAGQRLTAIEMGADLGQGYLWGKPGPL